MSHPANEYRATVIRTLVRLVLLALVGVVMVAAGLIVVARALGWQSGPTYYLVALTPYAGAVALVAAFVALLAGARWMALVGVLVFAVVAVWWAPMFWPDRPDAPESGLRVMTANIEFGEGEAAALVAAVESHRVDVLAVQELTEESAAKLRSAGLERALPHSYLRPGKGPQGSGVWSRHRIGHRSRVEGTTLANLDLVIEAPGGSIRFVDAHPTPAQPLSGDVGSADRQLVTDHILATSGPTIAAGDFNATWDHRPIRELTAGGFVDAADSAGAGLVRTWPSGANPWPPVVGIDHVLSRGMPSARSLEVIPIPDSDHLGLVAGF